MRKLRKVLNSEISRHEKMLCFQYVSIHPSPVYYFIRSQIAGATVSAETPRVLWAQSPPPTRPAEHETFPGKWKHVVPPVSPGPSPGVLLVGRAWNTSPERHSGVTQNRCSSHLSRGGAGLSSEFFPGDRAPAVRPTTLLRNLISATCNHNLVVSVTAQSFR